MYYSQVQGCKNDGIPRPDQQETKDDFAMNIEDSTHYVETSTNQTFSPFYPRENLKPFQNQSQIDNLQIKNSYLTAGQSQIQFQGDWHCRMDDFAQKLKMITEKELLQLKYESICDLDSNLEISSKISPPIGQVEKRKRGRPRKNPRDPSAFHFQCKHCKPAQLLNENQSLNQQFEKTEIQLSQSIISNSKIAKNVKHNMLMLNSKNRKLKFLLNSNQTQSVLGKRSLKKSGKTSINHQPKKRGRKPKPLGLVQNTTFLSSRFDHSVGLSKGSIQNQMDILQYSKKMIDPSLKSDIYDINNIVSLGFHPSSMRRNMEMDTSSWRNQSNIVIPESRQLQDLHRDPVIQDAISQEMQCLDIIHSTKTIINSQESIEESSDDEAELTDDETFLNRHERALTKLRFEQADNSKSSLSYKKLIQLGKGHVQNLIPSSISNNCNQSKNGQPTEELQEILNLEDGTPTIEQTAQQPICNTQIDGTKIRIMMLSQ
eukprot:403345200